MPKKVHKTSAQLPSPVKARTITSKKGQYKANLHNYIFKDSVIISSKDYNITTENMHYNTSNGIASFSPDEFSLSFSPPKLVASKDEPEWVRPGLRRDLFLLVLADPSTGLARAMI